jgi:hypothetical protein
MDNLVCASSGHLEVAKYASAAQPIKRPGKDEPWPTALLSGSA